MRWHIIEALLLKYWYITKNRLDRIFDVFYWPFMGLLIWGFTTYYLKSFTGNAIINIFIGGIILWTFFQRAQQDITTYILEDFWSRNLYNLFSSPMRGSELIASIMIFGFLRSLITFGFLCILSFLLFSFNIFGAGIFAIALFAFGLMIFGWAMGIFVAALIFRFGTRIQVFAWSFSWLIQPFSAVFYPLASMPVWVQKVSFVFPTTHIFEGMRYAFQTNQILWKNLAYAFGFDIVLLLIMCYVFKLSLDIARKKGLLTRRE
jgi:ABC-2 type transport system permease protein